MLRKFSLIGAGAVALVLPLPATASALQGGATNPGGTYVPYGGGVGKFPVIPAASTFIAVTAPNLH